MLNKQKGMATLFVTMVLLMLSSLAVMHGSKTVFFTQKSANNTYHYSQAMAAAQAGVDQGLSFLSNMKPGTMNRADLLNLSTMRLVATKFPLRGSLPRSRSAYTITMTQPDPVADPYTIVIRAVGCADSCGNSVSATVTQVIRLRKLSMHAPDDALITRGFIHLGGSVDVTNSSGIGVGVHAGSTVTVDGSSKVVGGKMQLDTKLAQTSGDTFFEYFFGDTRAEIKAQLPNLANTFPPDGTKGGAYWVEGDTAEHGGVYGSPTEPVILIVNGNLRINSNTVIYGMVYVVGGGLEGWSNGGGGTARIIGAAVSEASFSSTGNLGITKDSDVLAALSGGVTPAKVVGGWKDF